MVRKSLMLVMALLILLLGMVSAAGAQQLPYAIRVNCAANTVTIYTADQDGQYTVPYKAMICSTARSGHVTPLGEYQLTEYRSKWQLMLDGTYGQYATCFSGNYLFHPICYTDDAHDCMVRDSYNKLGEPASMGCVRLETVDAKWIYDNCPAGTPVTVYADAENPGPLGKPKRTVDFIPETGYTGWDPTDPAEGNPWHMEPVESVTVQPTRMTLNAGETATVAASVKPETAVVSWFSDKETVVKVDQNGNVLALGAGTAKITVQGANGVKAMCTVTVKQDLLPFDDLIPGAWYYPEIRQVLDGGLFSGIGARTFAPDRPMTRAMVVQVLYNLAGKPAVPETLAFTYVPEQAWYRDAVAWAAEAGIVNGTSETRFSPKRSMSRQELAAVLWRYAGEPKVSGTLDAYSDQDDIAEFALPAFRWMVKRGVLEGSGGKLQPCSTVSRVETAVIMQRAVQAGWK